MRKNYNTNREVLAWVKSRGSSNFQACLVGCGCGGRRVLAASWSSRVILGLAQGTFTQLVTLLSGVRDRRSITKCPTEDHNGDPRLFVQVWVALSSRGRVFPAIKPPIGGQQCRLKNTNWSMMFFLINGDRFCVGHKINEFKFLGGWIWRPWPIVNFFLLASQTINYTKVVFFFSKFSSIQIFNKINIL